MKYFRLIAISFLIVIICILSACHKYLPDGTTESTSSYYASFTDSSLPTSSSGSDILHTHVFIGQSCTDSGKCNCGSISEPLGHDFTEATCTESGVCKRCGIKSEPLGHDFTEATCIESGVCKRCGIKSKPLGHNFTEATCIESGICKRCGVLNGSALGHSYSGGICKRCKDTNGPLKPNEAVLFKNRLTDDENAQALAAARKIVEQINMIPEASDIDRIGMAAYLVSQEYYKGVHLESGNYYNTAYGVFIKRESSCAGCCRALGLVLSCMGYEWNHVNENKWKHQWISLTVNEQSIWADGQIGWAGMGEYPFA